MLRYLKITNLAIIDTVDVEFHEGFNVLTGETGAGKSILVGALNLLLGVKTSADIIRTGEEEAQVEGLFEIGDGAVGPDDLECEVDGNELVLARKVFRSGRSRCFINGNVATQAMLHSVGRSLISIFGQHEHYALLNADEHIQILDRFGGLEPLCRDTAQAHAAWRETTRQLEEALARAQNLEAQARDHAAAIEELGAASLNEGEEEKLVQEREILRKAVDIREKAFAAHQILYARSGSVLESLTEVRKNIEFLVAVDPSHAALKDNLEEAVYRVEDVALELRSVSQSADSDPVRLERIEDRLQLIRKLKRKYNTDVAGLIAKQEEISREEGARAEVANRVKALQRRLTEERARYVECARDLTARRAAAATDLEEALLDELKELAMPNATVQVRLDELAEDKWSGSGHDRVEFYLAANPGEQPRPLAKVASGGELSRIMLAVKALQIDVRGAPTVIFDEVDTGIGGRTALAVGNRLARVAERQQVLCVTHLHQIAALGHHHMLVNKEVHEGRTNIVVRTLDEETRVEELTRMLGASPDSESVKEHIKSLISPPAAGVRH